MVRWRESMHYLKTAGVEEVAEIGSGRVLTGLSRRIDPRFSSMFRLHGAPRWMPL